MHCYKLTLAYEGTHYSGWQIQQNAPSIQQHVQEVLSTLLHGEEIAVIGSGRTDSGVHARGQVAHFKTKQVLDLYRLLMALNGLLPKDIRVSKIEKADLNFHARYSALSKEYHYHLYLGKVMDPFRRFHCWQVRRELDLAALQQATTYFVGTHDFTSFANERYAGAVARNPVRTLYRLDVCPLEGGICLEFEGNGFLYKMVRNIVGTLVDAASNRLDASTIPALFEAKDRSLTSRAAAPHGLFLHHVTYPDDHLI